jgi:molybdenum cofactor guanylyltransferase
MQRSVETTGAIILAGGRATRMGGVDKALQRLGVKPLIGHVIDALKPQCAALVINANGDAARFSDFTVPVVADEVAGFLGPLAGVLAGLDHFAMRHPEIAFAVSVATDTPFLPADLVAKLNEARDSARADIAVARSCNIAHPTFALWPIMIRDDLRHALMHEDMRRVTAFFARHACAYADWDTAPLDPFFNVNTAADLRDAEAMLAGRSAVNRPAEPEK